MRRILAIFVLALLLCQSYAFAETKEIVAEGTYNMGDGETPTVAESRALLQAKRTAVEEAGTYVESYSKTKNFQLTADEIQVLASGVMEVEVLEKKRTVIGDGFNFWIKIKAKVSTDKMEEMAKRVKDKSVVEDYKRIQMAYDKSQKDIEELKRQLAGEKGDREKKQVEASITDDERLFQANEWFEKGYNHQLNNEYDAAIDAYTSAIALNPNLAEAYSNRGNAYANKSHMLNPRIEWKIESYNTIAFDPNIDKAIENYHKSIALNPTDHHANNFDDGRTYNNLGIAYLDKGQFDKAIENFKKTIAISSSDSLTYQYLGIAYVKAEQFDKAIESYNKTISLGMNDFYVYYLRGLAYHKKGKLDLAIENYNKIIAQTPYADAYNHLGAAYAKKGDKRRAISNFQKACDMGDEEGCKNLQKALGNR